MHRTILVSRLTQMESVVIGQVLVGKANKWIAGDLGLSQRTIEAHRANAFQKMRVRNAIELTQLFPALPTLQEPSPFYGRQLRGPVWYPCSDVS